MHAGATAMSIYNTLSPSQVAYVAGHSEPAVVVLETADHVARWSEALASGAATQVVVIDPDDATPAGALTWERAARARSRGAGAAPGRDRPALAGHRPRAAGDDPLHLGHDRQPQGRGDHAPQRALRGGERQPHRGARRPRRVENVTVSYLPYAHIAERVLGIYIPQVGRRPRAPGRRPVPAGRRPGRGPADPVLRRAPRLGEDPDRHRRPARDGDRRGQEAGRRRRDGRRAWSTSSPCRCGNQTSPELQARFDAVAAAVLTPMKSMLGLDRVTWAGSASAPMPLETARFFAGLGLCDLRHLRDDRDHRLGHRLRSRPLPARHRRPRPARHRDVASPRTGRSSPAARSTPAGTTRTPRPPPT